MEVKSDVVGHVEISLPVTREFVDDVLCTAFDSRYGGCWYWCAGIEPHYTFLGVDYKYEVVSRGGYLVVTDDDHKVRVLSLENFLNGYKLWLERNLKHVGVESAIDAGYIDAAEADAIVQLALFGELVYG